ncbi:hypothetical protein ABT010_33650 [Streptomyces sp. NPDC002668]|uniref:hypothetical protein n=1 Tax=Streptomyces sp. NPDC002668 TaxID=3154422 RepID=UPI00332625A7
MAAANELGLLGVQVPPTSAVPVLVVQNAFRDEEGPIEVWEDIYAPGVWQVASS